MVKEKSCVAIIYKKFKNDLYVLLLKHNKGHWSFPKGHVETSESEEETAKREIKEETNLDVELDTDFRYVSTYSPKKGVIKDVVFFAAIPITNKIVIQEDEIEEFSWYKYNEALKIITYEKDKKVLKLMKNYLDETIKKH